MARCGNRWRRKAPHSLPVALPTCERPRPPELGNLQLSLLAVQPTCERPLLPRPLLEPQRSKPPFDDTKSWCPFIVKAPRGRNEKTAALPHGDSSAG